MSNVEESVEQLILSIKESELYIEYRKQLERVKQYPELKAQIDEFRARNYELQMLSTSEDVFDKVAQFEMQYEEFRENPLVSDFLEAELAFCRMVQDVNIRLTSAMQFE